MLMLIVPSPRPYKALPLVSDDDDGDDGDGGDGGVGDDDDDE